MQRGEPITLENIQTYPELTREDLLDPEWVSAPVIGSTNRERTQITASQAVRFAKLHGKHVYRWPARRKEWEQKPLPKVNPDCIDDPGLFEWFVEGANGFFNENINKKNRLVIGARIQYHSIVPCSDEQKKYIENLAASSPAEAIIELKEPPFAINAKVIEVEITPEGIPL